MGTWRPTRRPTSSKQPAFPAKQADTIWVFFVSFVIREDLNDADRAPMRMGGVLGNIIPKRWCAIETNGALGKSSAFIKKVITGPSEPKETGANEISDGGRRLIRAYQM